MKGPLATISRKGDASSGPLVVMMWRQSGSSLLYLVEALRQRLLRDQAPGVAVAQKMRQFVRRGLDIEGYGDAADLLDSKIGDDELGAVGEHQGYLVPFPEAERPQVVSQGAGGPVQLPIGDPPFAMDDGNIFRKVLGALRQHASQTHDFSTPESAGERIPRGLPRVTRAEATEVVRRKDRRFPAVCCEGFKFSLFLSTGGENISTE